MVDAESKIKTDVKRKRIRHAYSRKELYHRWIHSSEYVYVSGTCKISGKYNYLFISDIGKNTPLVIDLLLLSIEMLIVFLYLINILVLLGN